MFQNAGVNGGTEQRREEGHFMFTHPDERKTKESKSKGELMIYAVIRVTAPRQPLPDDAFCAT